MVTSVSLVTGKSSIQIYLSIYIDLCFMFHLNWPVMETDLWSLYSVFVSLIAYLLILFH